MRLRPHDKCGNPAHPILHLGVSVSTLSFALLFAASSSAPDLLDSWKISYELNMGNFDELGKGNWFWFVFMAAVLLNVIIMLNLVVSILGDAFDKFGKTAKAEDVM